MNNLNKQIRKIYYDYDREQRVTDRGDILWDPVIIAYNDAPLWEIHATSTASGGPLITEDVVEWRASLDCDMNPENEPMCRTLNNDINVEQTESETVLRILLSGRTKKFLDTVTGRADGITSVFEIYGLDSNGKAAVRIRIKVSAVMSVDPDGSTLLDPIAAAAPDLAAGTEEGDYVRRMTDGGRSWVKAVIDASEQITEAVTGHNVDTHAHPDTFKTKLDSGHATDDNAHQTLLNAKLGIVHNTDATAHAALFGTRIADREKGTANGVATLDASAKIPVAQLPADIGSGIPYYVSEKVYAKGDIVAFKHEYEGEWVCLYRALKPGTLGDPYHATSVYPNGDWERLSGTVGYQFYDPKLANFARGQVTRIIPGNGLNITDYEGSGLDRPGGLQLEVNDSLAVDASGRLGVSGGSVWGILDPYGNKTFTIPVIDLRSDPTREVSRSDFLAVIVSHFTKKMTPQGFGQAYTLYSLDTGEQVFNNYFGDGYPFPQEIHFDFNDKSRVIIYISSVCGQFSGPAQMNAFLTNDGGLFNAAQ